MICGPRAAPGTADRLAFPSKQDRKRGRSGPSGCSGPHDQTEVTMAEELELNSTQVEHEYGGSEIQVLEGLEAVRKRP